jgi:hypothetical protein
MMAIKFSSCNFAITSAERELGEARLMALAEGPSYTSLEYVNGLLRTQGVLPKIEHFRSSGQFLCPCRSHEWSRIHSLNFRKRTFSRIQ